jgi:peroxiredoxin
LRSFEKSLDQFRSRRVMVVGISVDPPEVTREHAAKQGYTFPFLADTDGAVLRRYDLLHEDAGPNGTDISRPAEFLIDADGIVRWESITPSITARTRPEEVLRALDARGP